MWLLIDDVRDAGADVIARNAAAGKKMLAQQCWSHLLMDHDLGDVEDGYDVLTWGLAHGFVPDHVQLVTSNPVGRERMAAALIAAGYVARGRIDYYNQSVTPPLNSED